MDRTRCPACGRRVSRPEHRAEARRGLIREMLARGNPPTQAAIRAALRVAGHRVTQATVCRDLSRLGAVRHARTRWAMPGGVPSLELEPEGARQ